MEQILHVVDPQCVANVLFSHSDAQWQLGIFGILEDNWRIQKGNKEPHCPEVQYWKQYIWLADKERTVDSHHYSEDNIFAKDGHQPQMCQVMFFHLNSSQVCMLDTPTMNHCCCLSYLFLNHLIRKQSCPKHVILQIKMNKPNREILLDLLHPDAQSSQMTIITPSKKDNSQTGV